MNVERRATRDDDRELEKKSAECAASTAASAAA